MIVRHYHAQAATVNPVTLQQALQVALDDRLQVGTVSTGDYGNGLDGLPQGNLRILFSAPPTPDEDVRIAQVLAAHDPQVQTGAQQRAATLRARMATLAALIDVLPDDETTWTNAEIRRVLRYLLLKLRQ